MAGKKMTNGGCAFGKVSRNMIDNLSDDFKDFRTEIRTEFAELKKTNTELYNHLSKRMPAWVTVVFTIMGSILTGVIVWGLSR